MTETYIATTADGRHTLQVRRHGSDLVVRFDEGEHRLDVAQVGPRTFSARMGHRCYLLDLDPRASEVIVHINGEVVRAALITEREDRFAGLRKRRAGATSGPVRVSPPIAGKVIEILVAAGDEVEAGTPLLVLEAMKMENRLIAEIRGVVAELRVQVGDSVETADTLLTIVPPAIAEPT